MKRNSPKISGFGRFLLIYCAVLLLAGAAVLCVLWNSLEKYQVSADAAEQQKLEEEQQRAEKEAEQARLLELSRAPQVAFEAWFAEMTPARWEAIWLEDHEDCYDLPETVENVFTERYDPTALTCLKASDYTEECPRFVVQNDGETVARIAMSGSALDWTVSDIEIETEGEISAEITVPSTQKAYCNGIALTDGSEEISYFTCESIEDELTGPITWKTYSVEGLFVEPDLTSDPMDGLTITEAEDGTMLLTVSEGGTLGDRAVSFVRSYLYYYMAGSSDTWNNMTDVLYHVGQDSPIWQKVVKAEDGVSWNPSYSNIDTRATYAVLETVWAENCRSVDVTYDADCRLNGEFVDYRDGTMRVYFVNTGSGYQIVDMEIL